MTKDELLQQPENAYMDDKQQDFFRELLMKQRSELKTRIDEELDALRTYEHSSDLADAGSTEEQRQAHLRLMEREKKLLDKIDDAIQRLARGEYGWCEETGEPIGLPRLLLRPTATLSFEAKERQERLEKHLRQH